VSPGLKLLHRAGIGLMDIPVPDNLRMTMIWSIHTFSSNELVICHAVHVLDPEAIFLLLTGIK
jgi:hypothetical protein